MLKALARRTDSEIEDVMVDVSRRPLVLLILLLGITLPRRLRHDNTWLDRGSAG